MTPWPDGDVMALGPQKSVACFVGRLATAGFVESESKRKTKKTPLSPTRGIAQLVTDSEGVCLYSLFNKTL